MRNILLFAKYWLLSAAGAVFAVLWIIAAANTISESQPVEWIPFVVLGIAIGISFVSPLTSLTLVVSTVMTQLLIPGWRFAESNFAAYFGVFLVLAVVAAFASKSTRTIALAVSVTVGLCVGLIASPSVVAVYPDSGQVPSLIIGVVAFVVPWTLGLTVHLFLEKNAGLRRTRALEHEVAEAELELAIAIERDRTAQDVHDIMAHSLAIIVAQADGALCIKEQRPQAATESFTAIAETARESLGELRVLLQSLSTSPDGHSYPTLSDTKDLVERMRQTGLNITDNTFGEEALLTAGQQLAIYRILQESLTNALKHSDGPTAVRITRDWRGPGLALNIISTAAANLTGAGPRPMTRGITGMTERARLAGGWLSAERDEDDPRQFIVTAFIPTLPAAADASTLR